MPQKMSKKNKMKATANKKTTKKTSVKKPVAKKIVKKTMKKAIVKKPVAKKLAKKPTAKKPLAKKTVVQKPVVKKAVAPKPVARAQVAPKPLQKAAVAKPATQKTVASKPVAQPAKAVAVPAKPQAAVANKVLYKVGNHVVYPTHGVGKIMAEETQMIGDVELRMLVISFEKDKMTLRVPVHRATAAGLRPVSNTEQMKKVFVTLKSRARTSRGMWSRRAQEYETKINSGNIFFIAEVVRDLHQNVDQSERSYSERMIYESALARLVGELAACEGTDHKTATDKLMKLLRAKVAAAAAAIEAAKEAA